MRMKQWLTLGLVLVMTSMTIAGCGGKKEETTQDIFEAVEEPAEEAPAEEEAEPEDPDVPPAEGMERSHFTNQWVDAAINQNRPLAVMYPVNKQAMPQYGYDKISVFYEIMEEGDMSRQLAILEDWGDLERIGNIRSIRDYFVYAALEYDPIIIHYGGPEVYVTSILTREDVDNLNGVGGKMGGDYGAYFRVPEGSKSEHTAFTSAEKIKSAIDKAGFAVEHKTDYYGKPHFNFVNEKNVETLEGYADAVEATEIDMSPGFPATKSALKYNPDDKLYYKTIYGNPQVDAVSGNQLAFTNVIIQNAYYETRDAKGYLAFQMHDADTNRDGYYITQGKMIHVKWKKTGDYQPTQFFDDNGNEIKVNTGKTCIFVNKEDKTFNVNGTSYGAQS